MVTIKSSRQEKTSIIRRFTNWSTSTVGSIFWICIAILLVTLAATYHLRPYTSDDVIWQNALLSWRPFHGSVYFGDGTASYIAKVPIYWILSHFLSPGRRVLLAAGVTFSVGNFILLYWSSIYFLKKWGVKL